VPLALRINAPSRRIRPAPGPPWATQSKYLTDQFVHDGESLVANNDRLEAVKLLMTLNRQVFFEYQQLPKWNVRFRSVLGLF